MTSSDVPEGEIVAFAAALDRVSARPLGSDDQRERAPRMTRRRAAPFLGVSVAVVVVGGCWFLWARAASARAGDAEIRTAQDIIYPISPADVLGEAQHAIAPEPGPRVEDVDAGVPVAPDVAARTCSEGNGGACLTAGSRAERAGDLDGARTFYARGCTIGNHAGCCYEAGRVALRLDAAARDYFAPACSAGMLQACWQLARIEWRAGASPELEQHLRLVCGSEAMDNGDACDRLGILESRAGRVAEAATSFARACTLGASGGCGNLAHHIYNGIGVPQDRERGLGYYARACDGGVPSACVAEITVRTVRADQFGNGERLAVARRHCLEFGGDTSVCDAGGTH